ncbi:hypothetical protein L7F22_014025 [Adiantum nelumboides]|nr:hypothetical protein [Adiantum nelumboides]
MVKPLVITPKFDKSIMDELVKGMRDLKVKLAKLEEKGQPLGPLSRPRQLTKEGFVHRCIWCDSTDHTRRDCDGFSDALRKDVVFFKDVKIHLRETGLPLRTNFGKGGMQTLVEDMATNHVTSSIEAATYGVKIESFRDSMPENDVDKGNLWPNVMDLAKKGKLMKEVLHEAGDCIRLETGWNDLVDSMSMHAYITHCQNHEAIVEEKRRRENGDKGPSKRSTRSGGRNDATPPRAPPTEEAPSPEVTMEESTTGKKKEPAKVRMGKARQCMIEKLDQFDGRDISKFCQAYEEAMEDNGIDDSVAIKNFHLIVKPELRGPIEELQGQHSVSWRNFKVALKAEYFLEDSQRVTKQTFIKWVQMKNKRLTSREILREFEKKFDQLSTGEQQSLRSEKVELFVQAADSPLQKSLVQLLEDPAGELGLTNDWDAIPAPINLLVKRQKRIDKSIVVDSHEDFEENGIVEKIVEKPKASSSPTLEGKETPKVAQSSTLDDSTMDDLIKVDSLSVHAYIAKAQANEAFVKDKRKQEDEALETSKKQTRANTRSDGERMQKSTPIPEVQMKDASKDKKQSKVRGPSYKLRSDIELATNLKKVFEERILNSKVEMTLGDILGIAKQEFHEEIIDIIKRERHVLVEQETNPTNNQNILHEELEDLEEPRARIENDVVLKAKHAHFHEDEESDEVPRSHFLRSHWARATTETVVKIADFEGPILTLVDHGLEINLMSMTLYQKGKWPIDLDHGWRRRAANTQPGFLYGACANVKVTIGDVSDEQNFFVQDHSSYSLILGQPYIVALRMETKVLDDGSAYARVRSKDGKKAVQFMTVCVNHARNKEGLRDHPFPKIQKDFKENRFSQDFLGVPL